MLARSDQLQQAGEIDGSGLRDLRLGRPPSAHRDDHGIQAPTSGQTREGSRDGRLPGSLPRADHSHRRYRKRRTLDRRVQSEVPAQVREAPRERHARQLHPFPIAQHRFVGQIQHTLGLELVDRERERGHAVMTGDPRRQPELGRRARLELLAATHEQRADHVMAALTGGLDPPAGDRWIVLAVDQDDDPHRSG